MTPNVRLSLNYYRLQNPVCVRCQAAFITVPSITTPMLKYFHSAASSFRANARIVVFLI
jgi:hypothetical protein